MDIKEYGKPSLPDVMADLARVDFLSALKFGNRGRDVSLSLKLRDIPVGEIPLRDWNAAINYLSQGPPGEECETAKAQLNYALS